MNEKFSQLPTPEELAQFVTWPALEDALLGIKRDWENLQPQERVVVEISSQTDPVSTQSVHCYKYGCRKYSSIMPHFFLV